MEEWNYPACVCCQREVGRVNEMMWLACYHGVVCEECSSAPRDCMRGCQPQGFYHRSKELSQFNADLLANYNAYGWNKRKEFADYALFLARWIKASMTIPGVERVEVTTAHIVAVPSVEDRPVSLWDTDSGYCEACEQSLPENQFRCAHCQTVSFSRFSALHSEAAQTVDDVLAAIQPSLSHS